MGLFDFFKKDKSDVEQYYEERNIQSTPINAVNNFNAPEPMNNYSSGSNGSNFQFNVEDVFFITGRGVVVTGRVASGVVCVGDTVTLVQQGGMRKNVTVTGIEMFRKMLDVARAGDNVGVLLRDVSRGEIQRGDMLIK